MQICLGIFNGFDWLDLLHNQFWENHNNKIMQKCIDDFRDMLKWLHEVCMLSNYAKLVHWVFVQGLKGLRWNSI